MTFSLDQVAVVISCQIKHSQSLNIYPLAHISGTCVLTSVLMLFSHLIPTASCNGVPPTPLQVKRYHSAWEGGPKNPGTNRLVLIHLHNDQCALSCHLHHHPSAAQGHLHAIHSTSSIQYSFNLTTCPTHLHTL